MNLSGWRCSRCGGSPKDGEDLMERWGARGFRGRPEILRHAGQEDVLFRYADLDSLVCGGCLTPADLAEFKTLPVIGGDYLAGVSA